MDFRKLGLWETWTLGNFLLWDNLDFCNLGILDFEKLDHWVTWIWSNLGNLDFGKFVNCNHWETYELKNLTRALMAESISGLFDDKNYGPKNLLPGCNLGPKN